MPPKKKRTKPGPKPTGDALKGTHFRLSVETLAELDLIAASMSTEGMLHNRTDVVRILVRREALKIKEVGAISRIP